jgi:hypothetical protein
MGNCQCIEVTSNGSVNEILIDKYLAKKKLKQQNILDTNEEDEDDVLINDKCKNANSGFKNFKKNNPKINRLALVNLMNESQKSEILFEDFSYQSKKTVESSIDYYQISKTMFEFLNRIRLNPEKYVSMITNIINEFSNIQTVSTNSLNGQVNELEKSINNIKDLRKSYNSEKSNNSNLSINEQIKSYLKQEKNLSNLIELRDTLLKITESTEKKTDFVLWSEKVYLTAYEYLIEVEEKVSNNKEYLEKSSSQRVSEKLKINSICTEFNFIGYANFSPELTVFFLLLENKERFKNILFDNYAYGAACMFPVSGGSRTRTLFYFVNKNLKQPKIKGINPHTGETLELGLEEPIFDSINYKHLIINGSYNTDGETLNVIFNLVDGKQKEVSFLIS